jgi:hypothetical protein
MFLKSTTGEFTEEEANRFNRIADQINKELYVIKNNTKEYIFDIRTIGGLKNFISLFTFSKNLSTFVLDQNSIGDGHFAFGISDDLIQSKDKSKGPERVVALSFGTKNGTVSYKISKPPRGKEMNVGRKTSDDSKYQFNIADKANLKMNDFESFEEELLEHFKSSFFYSNVALVGHKDLRIPNISLEGEITFGETKSYDQILKENTTTNLTSFNIGTEENPNYIYTVQGNLEIDTSDIDLDKKDEIDSELKDLEKSKQKEEEKKVEAPEEETSMEADEEFIKRDTGNKYSTDNVDLDSPIDEDYSFGNATYGTTEVSTFNITYAPHLNEAAITFINGLPSLLRTDFKVNKREKNMTIIC